MDNSVRGVTVRFYVGDKDDGSHNQVVWMCAAVPRKGDIVYAKDPHGVTSRMKVREVTWVYHPEITFLPAWLSAEIRLRETWPWE